MALYSTGDLQTFNTYFTNAQKKHLSGKMQDSLSKSVSSLFGYLMTSFKKQLQQTKSE